MTLTWSERIKLAWTTFKREALPLYAWSFIFLGVGVVLFVAMVMGVIIQLRQSGWAFPHPFGEAYSPGMPVPGIPPREDLTPFNPFGSPNQSPFGYFGNSLSNYPNLLSTIGTITGISLLILVIGWLIGSAFYTGLFNLTAKAYKEKTTFKDFSFRGFLRVLGWLGFLLLIKLLILAIGAIGAYYLGHSRYALVAYLIIYSLFLIAIGLYALPWLITSTIYLLAHSKESFWDALRGSWRFFQSHMGVLWGYIGTVVLIEIALQVLGRISQPLTGIASLIVSPFIVVLAIVWVLSLEDDGHRNDIGPQSNSTAYSTVPYQEAQEIINSSLPSDSQSLDSLMADPQEPKINLHKAEVSPPYPDDSPNYCPSCGRANTGTAYCPQCGTKLQAE